MAAKKRALMIGAGGMAGVWINQFLPGFSDRLEIVGLVDVRRPALDASGDFLGLNPGQQFVDASAAFASVDADCCIVVVPPAFHTPLIVQAAARGLPILSEKPISDTWEGCLAAYRAVKAAGVKMQVIQNYRYNAPMVTLRNVLRSGSLGRVNYVVGRFAADYREPLSWGAAFRHEIPHALLVEGGVHHFDMLRNLSGGDCATLAGSEWNPPWSTSKGEFCAMFTMTMSNGVRASYEGSGTAAGEQNTWHDEHYRAECEKGSVAVGRDHVVRIHRFTRGGGLITEEVVPTKPTWEGHNYLIDEFLTWLDGGPTPATIIDDNIKTAAMLFGAIEASRAKQTVDIEAMLTEALGTETRLLNT